MEAKIRGRCHLQGKLINYCRMKAITILGNLRKGISIIVMVCLVSCQRSTGTKEIKIERAFYYWKSVYELTVFEKKQMAALHVKTLYLKFFDVDWDNSSSQPLPVARLRIKDDGYLRDSLRVIPVVFITNACIRDIDSLNAKEVAAKIVTLVQDICKTDELKFTELQIDCDWTEQTKENYFILLREVKKKLNKDIELSATIRLYQIKYKNKTGVPPVDRGLMMAYNMGDLKDPSAGNSILDTKELKKYTGNLSTYPLPLDVGLPLFDWKVLFRKNSYAGLIENLPDTFLNKTVAEPVTGNRYRVLMDTVVNAYTLLRGDIIRKEESHYDDIISAEKIISENIPAGRLRVSLFHLDSVILKKYTSHEMENIFNGMH